MQPSFTRLRRPVEREGAELYLFLLLLSFAASVSLTRLFLELTGYPQLGNQTLHIAHVLWGGLLLFISALLMLIYANRWVYRLGAILAGIGVGLFMDEVGKFITQTNDYFYPPAASIIYAFFLLVVIFYMEVRPLNRRDVRSELSGALDTFQDMYDLARWLLSGGSPSPEYLIRVLLDQITYGRVTGVTSLAWLTGAKALKAACGLALLIGIGLWLARREEQGLRLIFFVLLLFLTMVDLLEFYFEQFSTILPATLQLGLLLFLLHYRRRFM